jgi:radical SAM superfamily enzyme YgiQ (UPF0313 family)
MRIALLYPPPWKLPAPGEAPDGTHGPPPGYQEGDLDPDFWQTPYGLLSLGAQALRAGHAVKLWNLSAFPWREVEATVRALEADLFGLSCWTANRRGVALVAEAIKRFHPSAHVIVGGPHATPLAEEMLAHHPDIDTIAVGESEETFLELIARLESGESPRGLAGTVYRSEGRVLRGPKRPNITNLDTLASPHEYFTTHIVMTSRGCPWQCTFCGAETTWGRGFRARSVRRVLDDLEAALRRAPVRMLQIKDDTFTTSRKRVLELCRGIRERNLRFAWSCDTRVDVLDEELVRELRLAGCERMSLGVESGSQPILNAIKKKITKEQILASTELVKRYGIRVRYYMMLGNRGETLETFQESLDFLEQARPHQYLFSCLSIYPGTEDFDDAEASGLISRAQYFTESFQELKVTFDASAEVTAVLNQWFQANKGLRTLHEVTTAEARGILERLGDHWAAHLDLAAALLRERDLDGAEAHARRALEVGHPAPGLAHNLLGCAAFQRGNITGMQDAFMTAAKQDPQHPALVRNVQAARAWFAERGPERGLPLNLVARHDFELLERTSQPSLPGPLPLDFADFGSVREGGRNAPAQAPDSGARSTPDTEGGSRRLPVVS